jgi:hypothetical protein
MYPIHFYPDQDLLTEFTVRVFLDHGYPRLLAQFRLVLWWKRGFPFFDPLPLRL